ncbi:serine O-acetyltransferase EpsC [Cytobacillus firmus]|uniref:serine O-acetyltransferase EpsC n=1 Tax=Cytobacillus firmus TaxID=1399 RepID=UPI00202F958B|nr:serine O-acetyltransferase EpsC [Cytobacillus firmus]URT70595.1 serine O-acetyltransferase [Cytobacillus firmus]
MIKKIKADIIRMYDGKYSKINIVKMAFTHSNLQCLLLFRLQEALFQKNIPILPSLLKYLNQFLTGAEIGLPVRIGKGLVIRHSNGIVIGNGVEIGEDCTLLHQITLGEKYGDGKDSKHLYPNIGNRVVISCGVKILGGITIGNDVTIGANAVVINDIKANTIAVGIPAKTIEKKD